jgi:hypothetical protein
MRLTTTESHACAAQGAVAVSLRESRQGTLPTGPFFAAAGQVYRSSKVSIYSRGLAPRGPAWGEGAYGSPSVFSCAPGSLRDLSKGFVEDRTGLFVSTNRPARRQELPARPRRQLQDDERGACEARPDRRRARRRTEPGRPAACAARAADEADAPPELRRLHRTSARRRWRCTEMRVTGSGRSRTRRRRRSPPPTFKPGSPRTAPRATTTGRSRRSRSGTTSRACARCSTSRT